MTKILASLLDRGLLGGKAYGKTCIYVARQDNFPAPSNEELETIDEEIKQLVEQVAQQRESTQQSQARLNKLQNTLTVEEMQTRLMQVTKEMESLETRLQVLRSGDNKVDAAAKAKLDSQFDLLHKEWRLRKRMVCFSCCVANVSAWMRFMQSQRICRSRRKSLWKSLAWTWIPWRPSEGSSK